MPLLDPIPPAQDLAIQEADHVLRDTAALHAHCVHAVTAIYQLVWNNPHGAAPADILAAVGPKATELFILSAQFQELLNAARPDSIMLSPPVAIEFHEDGTVTIPVVEPKLEPKE